MFKVRYFNDHHLQVHFKNGDLKSNVDTINFDSFQEALIWSMRTAEGKDFNSNEAEIKNIIEAFKSNLIDYLLIDNPGIWIDDDDRVRKGHCSIQTNGTKRYDIRTLGHKVFRERVRERELGVVGQEEFKSGIITHTLNNLNRVILK